MRRTIQTWVVLLLGWILVLIGVAGILLPVLPGIPFFIVGFGILSSKSRWARRMKERWKARHQHQETLLSSWREKLKRVVKRA